MDERPLVSVVVPTRNRADLLSDALGSLVEQDYPADRYEILVVDDGSIDDTPSLVEALAQAQPEPRLSLLRQPARNQNAARNRGVSEAKGELIAFFDDDELAPGDWLSGLVAGSTRHPEADVVGGPYRIRFEAPAPRLCERCWPGDGVFGWGDEERQAEHVSAGNMLIRARAFESTGPFDESLQGWGDETEWMIRHRRTGGRVIYLPTVPIWHRRRATDLRLSKRLGRFYRIGRSLARLDGKVGRPMPVVTHIALVPRLLAHAARRRCSGGVTQAARSLGYAKEAMWQAISR
jgi:glucosyl-dolichyl phosphate glucuronosyltransferase